MLSNLHITRLLVSDMIGAITVSIGLFVARDVLIDHALGGREQLGSDKVSHSSK
jgi:hypothetical protein